MIICAGEILADMIGTEKDGNFFFERKAGGAPFNVACAAKMFGSQVAFFGCVGNDLIGQFLLDFANGKSLDRVGIAVDSERNTTLAFVQLSASGERSFSFFRHNTADIQLPEIPDSLLKEATVVHIGSLMLSDALGRKYAQNLSRRAHQFKIPVSFDVNYREDIFPDKEQAKTIYKEMLKEADLIKFSEEEVEIFTADFIAEELKDKTVFITHGKDGSEWRHRGRNHHLPTFAVTPVDTTGAGDAFWAGVLTCLDGIPAFDFTDELLDRAARFGNVAGALNTLGKGAIDSLPTLHQIRQYL